MRIRPCGDLAFLVELGSLEHVRSLYSSLSSSVPEGVVDLVPAARTILVRVLPGHRARAEEAVKNSPMRAVGGVRRETVRIPVVYDGQDLADVAQLTGLRPHEVVDAHAGAEWEVAFCGFSPGFAYMVSPQNPLHVPRRSQSRTVVPEGSVAIAGEFAGVYPRRSPGGWQLIGRTSERVWDLDRDPKALLRPGVRVRFEPVGPLPGPGRPDRS